MLRLKSRALGPRLLGPDPYFFLRPPLRLRPARLRGTFPPARRASLRPIAIACLRLVTFFPERPERSLPRFRSRIARSTFSLAFFPYFAMRNLLARQFCKEQARRQSVSTYVERAITSELRRATSTSMLCTPR